MSERATCEIEYWKARVTYNPETGEFWDNERSIPTGHSRGTNGYRKLYQNGKQQYAHRVAVLLMTGDWPPSEVDHINGNRGDNRWANLRCATRGENQANAAIKVGRSGFRGVWPDKTKWKAMVTHNYRRIFVGLFDTPEEAARARDAAMSAIYGQFAKMNANPLGEHQPREVADE